MKHPGPILAPPGSGPYSAWGNDLVTRLNTFFQGLGSDTEFSGTLTTKGRIKNVNGISAASYNATYADHVIDVSAGTCTVTLPAAPPKGKEYIVQDSSGAANITIAPASGTINNAASIVLATNYGRKTIVYNGTQYIAA